VVEEARRARPSPGKRIWELLPEEAKQTVLAAGARGRIGKVEKRTVLEGLRQVLERRDFRDERHFSREDMARFDLALAQQMHRYMRDMNVYCANRALLTACYPELVRADRGAEAQMDQWCAFNPDMARGPGVVYGRAVPRRLPWLGVLVVLVPLGMFVLGYVRPESGIALEDRHLIVATWFAFVIAWLSFGRCVADGSVLQRRLNRLDRRLTDASGRIDDQLA